MKKEFRIVARTKNGETIKGFVNKDELSRINTNESVYVRFADPGNTVGTYICQDQLEGLFLVKTFEGEKPFFILRFYYDTRRTIKDNFSIITAATIMASLSVIGLMALF